MAKIHLKDTLFIQKISGVKIVPSFKNININKVLLRKFIQVIQYLCILIIVIHITATIWQYIAFSPEANKEHQKSNDTLFNKQLSLSPQEWQLIQKQHWFGEYKKEEKPQPIVSEKKIEETRLSITLRGISYGSHSSAVIEEDGKQSVYQKGELLANGKTIIKDIYHSYILLDSNGKIEKLSLADENSTTETSDIPPQHQGAMSATSDSNVPPGIPDEIRQSIRKSPQKVFDYIQLIPYKKNDVIGYEIRPGKNRTLFDIYGFKLGDIITSVNNNDITNKRQIMMLMRQLPTMDSIQLTVMRNNIRHMITIKLR